MKIICNPSPDPRSTRAMTLAELMTSMSIFTLIFGGLLAVTMFGMRQDQLTNSQLGANDQSRETFNLMLDEIRSSKDVQIGSGNYSNFVALTNGPQQGPTIQIIPSYDLNAFIYYYFDTNFGTLTRAACSTNGTVTTNLVCQYLTNLTSTWLTNSMTFRAMDYTGTTNLTVDPTNYNTYNYVVQVLLQFYQFQFPQTTVSSNSLYNYYQLTYSATRRAP